MGHVFHMISYVDCDVDCGMDSYMPGGGGMLTTDIEASRWSNKFSHLSLLRNTYAVRVATRFLLDGVFLQGP